MKTNHPWGEVINVNVSFIQNSTAYNKIWDNSAVQTFMATCGRKLFPGSTRQCPCSEEHVCKVMVWCGQTWVARREQLTWAQSNTSGMNWKADSTSGLTTPHQRPTSLMLSRLDEKKHKPCSQVPEKTLIVEIRTISRLFSCHCLSVLIWLEGKQRINLMLFISVFFHLKLPVYSSYQLNIIQYLFFEVVLNAVKINEINFQWYISSEFPFQQTWKAERTKHFRLRTLCNPITKHHSQLVLNNTSTDAFLFLQSDHGDV